MLRGEAVWEWTPESATLVRRWSSWEHLSPVVDRGPRFGTEWMHANALSYGARGNVLLSVHYFDQVISLAPDLGSIEWRLGGVNATIAVDDADAFSGQHTPQEVGASSILMFDNGVDRGRPSRAVEYEIVGNRAVKRWEWQTPGGNYAGAVGSARRLENGNVLAAFGMSAGIVNSTGPTEVFEVSPAGQVIWHMRVTGTTTMFRAEPIAAITAESE
jgi:hypothetical protein